MVTETLLQCLWLMENSEIDKDRLKNADKSDRTKIFFAQLWAQSHGRLISSGQTVFTIFIAFEESFRKDDITGFFNVLQIVCLLCACQFYMWVYSFYGDKFYLLLHDLLRVARRLEPLSTEATRRRCELIIRLARVIFWAFFGLATALGTLMIMEPPFRSAFPIGHRFPKKEDIGDRAATFISIAGWLWESYLVYTIGLTCAWMDGLHCAGLLAITSLLKMLRHAMETCDIVHDPSGARNLLHYHQILLNVGARMNKLMSLTIFSVYVATFVIGLTTSYCVIKAKPSAPIFVSLTIAVGTSIFLSMISEILMEANEEIGEAFYKGDWFLHLFSLSSPLSTSELSNLRFIMMMVKMRAARPLCVQARFMGGVGNAFIMKYFQRMYKCLQGLLKLVEM